MLPQIWLCLAKKPYKNLNKLTKVEYNMKRLYQIQEHWLSSLQSDKVITYSAHRAGSRLVYYNEKMHHSKLIMVLHNMFKENRILTSTDTSSMKSHITTRIIYLNNNKRRRGLTTQTNWSRYSSTVVYLTSGYSWEASTPNDGSISKLVWSPFTNTEWLIANTTLIGIGDSARKNVPWSKTFLDIILVTNISIRKHERT